MLLACTVKARRTMDVMNVEEYKTWIGAIARRYRQSQIEAAPAINVEMLKFY